jgi:hypothetical protein
MILNTIICLYIASSKLIITDSVTDGKIKDLDIFVIINRYHTITTQ